MNKPPGECSVRPLAKLQLRLNKPRCYGRTTHKDSYGYGTREKSTKKFSEIHRHGFRIMEPTATNLASTERQAQNFIRIADRKYREVPHPPICTVQDDIKNVLDDGSASSISTTKYRDYRRNGPRLPYQMWPKKVADVKELDVEPERFDTYVRMENEYYRKMHKLNRHLWKVTDPVSNKKLIKIPKFHEQMNNTRPQGPSRKPRHVEIDIDEIVKHPDASELQRMHHLWEAMERLKVKVVKCTKEVEKEACLASNYKHKTAQTHDDGRYGIPMPSAGFTDPSPAPPKPQIIKEGGLRLHQHKYEDDEELTKLFYQLTEDERNNIRNTCTRIMQMRNDHIEDRVQSDDVIVKLLNQARREAIRCGCCEAYSNYWTTVSLKHFPNWANFQDLLKKGNPEYFSANYENDHVLDCCTNTEAAMETKYDPYMVVLYPERKAEGETSKVEDEEEELERKYKWKKNDRHPQAITRTTLRKMTPYGIEPTLVHCIQPYQSSIDMSRLMKNEESNPIQSVLLPLTTSTQYQDQYQWNKAQKNDYDYNLIKTYYGRGTFWNMEVRENAKRDSQPHIQTLIETRKVYKDALDDGTVQVPDKLEVADNKEWKTSADSDHDPKRADELLALWKRKRLPPGRVGNTEYISITQRDFVDKKFGHYDTRKKEQKK